MMWSNEIAKWLQPSFLCLPLEFSLLEIPEKSSTKIEFLFPRQRGMEWITLLLILASLPLWRED